jgi:hypothetical protein
MAAVRVTFAADESFWNVLKSSACGRSRCPTGILRFIGAAIFSGFTRLFFVYPISLPPVRSPAFSTACNSALIPSIIQVCHPVLPAK